MRLFCQCLIIVLNYCGNDNRGINDIMSYTLELDRSFVSVIRDRHIGKILQHRLSARADCR